MSKTTKKTAKVYNDVGLWETRNGNGFTATLTEDTITRLQRILELAETNGGGKIYVGPIKEEYQRENGPTYKLDYLPPREEQAAATDSI